MRQPPFIIQIGLFLVLALWSANAAELPTWETDIDVALRRSNQEGKDLLLVFRGPSINKECKLVNEQVLDGIEFRTVLGNQFILFTVLDPRDAELDEAGKAAYKALLDRFNIDVYPISLLADSAGRVYGQTTVQRPEAKFFVQAIAELGPNREIMLKALALASKDDAGPDEAKELSAALEKLGVNFVIQHHSGLVDRVIELDDDDALGLKSLWDERSYKAKTLRVYNQIYVSIAPLLSAKKNPEEKIQLIDETIARHSMQGELQQLMEMRKFWVWNEVGDHQKMLETLQRVQALAPDTALAKRIPQLLELVNKKSSELDKPDADGGADGKSEGDPPPPAEPANSSEGDPLSGADGGGTQP